MSEDEYKIVAIPTSEDQLFEVVTARPEKIAKATQDMVKVGEDDYDIDFDEGMDDLREFAIEIRACLIVTFLYFDAISNSIFSDLGENYKEVELLNDLRNRFMEKVSDIIFYCENTLKFCDSVEERLEEIEEENREAIHHAICPKCGSNKFVIKDGTRNVKGGKKQRWKCTRCDRSFVRGSW